MKILDACAGAGGKSLHLASLMGNRGHIISCDIEAKNSSNCVAVPVETGFRASKPFRRKS
jgi:16S rRNA C967 or C1407 C5-methylase (RsmB/RsmF family)